MGYTISETQLVHRAIAEAVGYSIRCHRQTVRLARECGEGERPEIEEIDVWACTLVAPSGCDVDSTLFRAADFPDAEPMDAAWERLAPLFMYSLDTASQACDWAMQRVALVRGARANTYGYRRVGREAMYEGWFGRYRVMDDLPSRALALALHEAVTSHQTRGGEQGGVDRDEWICQMYRDGVPIDDIATRAGLTRQRIDQIRRRARVPLRRNTQQTHAA